MKKVFFAALCLIFMTACSFNENKAMGGSNLKNSSLEASQKEITVNKISFIEVKDNDVPENLVNSIYVLKANRGYLSYEKDGAFYVAIFSGMENTGGYSIRVKTVEENNGKTMILTEEKAPKQGTIVSQVITYPYTVIKLRGIAKNLIIKDASGQSYEFLNRLTFDY